WDLSDPATDIDAELRSVLSPIRRGPTAHRGCPPSAPEADHHEAWNRERPTPDLGAQRSALLLPCEWRAQRCPRGRVSGDRGQAGTSCDVLERSVAGRATRSACAAHGR